MSGLHVVESGTRRRGKEEEEEAEEQEVPEEGEKMKKKEKRCSKEGGKAGMPCGGCIHTCVSSTCLGSMLLIKMMHSLRNSRQSMTEFWHRHGNFEALSVLMTKVR